MIHLLHSVYRKAILYIYIYIYIHNIRNIISMRHINIENLLTLLTYKIYEKVLYVIKYHI